MSRSSFIEQWSTPKYLEKRRFTQFSMCRENINALVLRIESEDIKGIEETLAKSSLCIDAHVSLTVRSSQSLLDFCTRENLDLLLKFDCIPNTRTLDFSSSQLYKFSYALP